MLERGEVNFKDKSIEQNEPTPASGSEIGETRGWVDSRIIKSRLENVRGHYQQTGGILSKELGERIKGELGYWEKMATRNGVDFSRCQMDRIIGAYKEGTKFEFESFSPYLSDHNLATGEILRDNLTNEEAAGLSVAKILRDAFPKARIISLYDEYNTNLPDTSDARGVPTAGGRQIELPNEVKQNFVNDIEQLLREKGIIREGDRAEENYKFVSESSKIADAEKLKERLLANGNILEEDGALYFVNDKAENPVYRKILLRTKNDRWMCEALDASSYLDPKNLEITHLVVLPNHFKEQQDKVWEILRVLGIQPDNYHNIFFDDKQSPEVVAQTIREEIERYQSLGSKDPF